MSDMALCYNTSFNGSIGRSDSSFLDLTGLILLRVDRIKAKNSPILAFVGDILPLKPTMQGPLPFKAGFVPP